MRTQFISMQKQKGVSLIEVMVTVAIAVILVTVGMPSMSAWVQSSQMDSRASTLATVLRAARGEALTRNNSVTLSTTTFGDWSGVINMYMDTAGGNSPFNQADGDEFIREIDLGSGLVSIKGNAAAGNYISFSGDGRLEEGGDTVTLEVCRGTPGNLDTTNGQTISINIVGRVSVSEGVTDCTP